MGKKYIFVRMPEETYRRYVTIKLNMEKDITKVTGKETKLPMTKVFKAVASPAINENYIQVDMSNLIKLAKERRK